MPKRSKASERVGITALNQFRDVTSSQAEKGFTKYGTPLMTFNGRDAHADALAELVDAVQYTVQARMEREEIVRRAQGMAARLRLRASVAPQGCPCEDCTALSAWDALGLSEGE